jgi:carboxypeptidase T
MRGQLATLLLLFAGTVIAARSHEPSASSAPRRMLVRAPASAQVFALEVWSEDPAPGEPIDMVVSSDTWEGLADTGLVLDPDIDVTAAAERARLSGPLAKAQSPKPKAQSFFDDYRDYGAIAERMREDAALAPDRAEYAAIGTSLEGRPIFALHIGHRGGMPMIVDGTQHAREWIAAMTATCVADRLVRDYDTDPAIRAFVDSTNLWIVPVANPDGYQYTWTKDRYWRKNRRDEVGVDLNRNWSVAFGGPGSSGRERSEVYRGPHAFSEPESIALRDLADRVSPGLYIDFHTYGQLILYPWAHTYAPADDRDRLAGVGDRMASAMFEKHESRYRLQSGAELYPASGTTMDWMYGEKKALAYAIELRPKGGSGFVLPPDQIAPTCDEGLAAVLTLRDMAAR